MIYLLLLIVGFGNPKTISLERESGEVQSLMDPDNFLVSSYFTLNSTLHFIMEIELFLLHTTKTSTDSKYEIIRSNRILPKIQLKNIRAKPALKH